MILYVMFQITFFQQKCILVLIIGLFIIRFEKSGSVLFIDDKLTDLYPWCPFSCGAIGCCLLLPYL